jgi:tRNA uridine 5-carbamoylmethylation protein Kti12
MLKTKLILIEGLPGSGKTTTTVYLGQLLQGRGIACRWHLEEDQTHPIPCDDVQIKHLTEKMVPRWQAFVEAAVRDPAVSIIESRLWQNTALFMYMSTYPAEDVVRYHQHVWQVLEPLAPVLLYLYQDNTDAALRRNYALRGEQWVEEMLQSTSTYAWFQSRGRADFDDWVRFFVEWGQVAECLYADWPYRKTRMLNPHDDWPAAYQQMAAFLQL